MQNNFLDNKFLIECLVKENKKAYTFLVNTYHKDLFVYALSLTSNHAFSQDIVQNVFLKTWEFRKKLNSSHSMKSFLLKSVYNEFVNKYHKKKSVSTLEKIYIEHLNSIVEPENETLLKEKITLVNSAIKKLPPKCKTVFILSKKEGLTNLEIANYLNISVKSVEAHITKGFSLIRKATKNKLKIILFQFLKILN